MKCIVCNAEMKPHTKINGLLKCKKCSFVCADMNMSDYDFSKLYSSNYFSGEEYTDYVSDHELHAFNFRQKLKRMESVIGDLSDLNCFEIGSAYGFFLEQAQTFFKKCSGVDISEDAIKYARETTKVDAIAGDFLDLDIKEKTNVICMWDTIEHLSNPKGFVEKAYDVLEPNGYICITTGDIGSLNARIRGRKWRQIHPPTHLQYFSRKTLTSLLNNSNFEVVDVTYPANKLSFRNIYYSIFCLRMKRTKWYDKNINNPLLNCTIPINLHDYMYVIAKKK